MNYAELKKILSDMTHEELAQTVTAYINCDDEFVPISSVLVTTESDVLDAGHIYFSV